MAIECDLCRALHKPLEKPNSTWGELVLTTAWVWGGGVGGKCEDIGLTIHLIMLEFKL